jgi:exopolysaccharide biosynthesis polyprenyl glycosylphosphotransferase
MSDFARASVADAAVSESFAADIEREQGAERAHPIQHACKRVIDWCVAFIGLVLISPLLAAVAIAVKLDSPGPVFFRQRRIGRREQPFTFLKFRTMEDGNDPSVHRRYVSALIREQVDGLKSEHGLYKIEADPRVTRVGHFLRRTSIDELPQLWNVLRGEMSLVGPRPPIDYEVELYGAREYRRLTVLPGITGLWQVSGRCETTYQQMVDLDLKYIDSWSLALDLKILVRTIGVVLGRRGAW